MKKSIKQDGITLVALVVTIVILLILASISLNGLLGENSLVKKSKMAKEKYEQEQKNEIEIMNYMDKKLSSKYIISYNANGGTNAPEEQEKIEGKDIIIAEEEPTREDYIFVGWSRDKKAEDFEIKGGDIYTENNDLILYAVWKPKKLYIYDEGKEFENLTGGWKPKLLLQWGSNSAVTYSVNKQDNYLYGQTTQKSTYDYEGGKAVGFVTNKKINLKYYNKLKVYLDFYTNYNAQIYFYVANEEEYDPVQDRIFGISGDEGKYNKIQTLEADIKDFDIEKYIILALSSSSSVTTNGRLSIYKVWLEIE